MENRQIEETDEYLLQEALHDIHDTITEYTQIGEIDEINVNLLAEFLVRHTKIAPQLYEELKWQLGYKDPFYA